MISVGVAIFDFYHRFSFLLQTSLVSFESRAKTRQIVKKIAAKTNSHIKIQIMQVLSAEIRDKIRDDCELSFNHRQ